MEINEGTCRTTFLFSQAPKKLVPKRERMDALTRRIYWSNSAMIANLPQSMQSPHFLRVLHASHTLLSHPSHLLSCESIPHMWHRACSAVKGAFLEPEPITAQLPTMSAKGGAHCEVLVAGGNTTAGPHVRKLASRPAKVAPTAKY